MKTVLTVHSRLWLYAGFLFLSWFSLCSSRTTPTLEEILLRVQGHVREFEFSLPDFTCNERITSRQMVGGKISHQTVVDSVFSGRQMDEKETPFSESREIRIIDGKQAARGEQLRVPFFFGGGFSSILDATFGEKNVPYHNYKLAGTRKVEGRTALIIKFETKPGQTEVCFDFMGRKIISKDRGKAWVDPETMQVVHLERTYLNLPPADGVLVVSVDYAKAVINGKTFWMPRTVRAEETQPSAHYKKTASAEYVAEYSNYRKFGVSVQMKY